MTTYETDSDSTAVTYIWSRNGGERRIHSAFYGGENVNHERDAEIACDALNKFAERSAQPVTPEDSVIAEQKN